jgi:hypothetical protein
MYAQAIDDTWAGEGRVQMLSRLCKRPRNAKHCVVMPGGLQRSLEDAVNRRITFVRRKWPHLGDFWVLSPLTFDGNKAQFTYAWDEPGAEGCSGNGRLKFRKTSSGWEVSGGYGEKDCPVAG